MSSDIVLRADGLAKTFHLGFLRKRIEAVREATFDVRRGEIFGYLGPNGSGKTTTLKMLMGLVFPTRGRAEVLGRPVPNRQAKRKLGYLPETPYFYEYLSPEEFLDLVGALCDVPRRVRRERATRLIGRVGLDHARGRPLRKFSKGMLQRIGIAQALMGDPELVVLDEPMTGLDPLGRKEVRDLMLELKHEGRTVVCLRSGSGPVPELPASATTHQSPDGVLVELPEGADVDAFLKTALGSGASVLSVTPRRESLEDLFVREASAKGAS
jgi:ABC-2 type transport system ATP-binding protein